MEQAHWLIPWHPITTRNREDHLAHELQREVCRQHVLFNVPVKSIGYRQDCDDVLFQLLDGSERVAVVHLTYAQHPEPDPAWPNTKLFENWDAFVRDELRPVHEEWSTGTS